MKHFPSPCLVLLSPLPPERVCSLLWLISCTKPFFSVYPACQELRAEISAGFGIIQCILLVVIWASVLLSASPVCAGQLTVGKPLQEGWALLAALHLLIHIWPGCLHVALRSENRRPASPRNRNYRNAV